jgi:hypothetical protein
VNSSNIGECSNCHAAKATATYRGRVPCRQCYEANIPSWNRATPELSDSDQSLTRIAEGPTEVSSPTAIETANRPELIDDIQMTRSQYAFFPVATHKFVVMSICTFGLYELYWCFKNWQRIRQRSGENLSPFWRAVFAPLWSFSLFRRIRDYARHQQVTVNWSPGWLGTLYLLLRASGGLPDPWWLISFVAFMPIVAVVRTTYAIHEKEKAPESLNTSYSDANRAWIILGGSLVILAIMGAFTPA